MRNNNKGFAPLSVVLIIVLILLVGVGAYYFGKSSNTRQIVVNDSAEDVFQDKDDQVIENNNSSQHTNTNEKNVVKSIKVLYPNNGETIQVGQIYTIKWSTVGFSSSDDVSISLSDESYSCELRPPGCQNNFLVSTTKNTGSFIWDTNKKMSGPSTGPNTVSVFEGNNFKVNVSISSSTNSSASISDTSDKPFVIQALQ